GLDAPDGDAVSVGATVPMTVAAGTGRVLGPVPAGAAPLGAGVAVTPGRRPGLRPMSGNPGRCTGEAVATATRMSARLAARTAPRPRPTTVTTRRRRPDRSRKTGRGPDPRTRATMDRQLSFGAFDGGWVG